MRLQELTRAFAVGALLAATTSHAQDAIEPLSNGADEASSAACCTVAAMTVVEIEILDALDSKRNRPGDLFAIRLAAPLIVDGRVVAPAGTPGVGEVIHAARARAMGKAGELILAARFLDLDGRRIPLRSFRYGPSQGKDESQSVGIGSAVAGAVIPGAALAAFLIPGGEIHVPAGTRAHAKVTAETQIH